MCKRTCFLSGVLSIAFLAVLFVFVSPSAAFAVSPSEAAEPSHGIDGSILPDTGQMGCVILQASSPLGFEGVICIELRDKDGESQILELNALEDYLEEIQIPVGIYTVDRVYVLGSDHFTVDCQEKEVVVTADGVAHLTLRVLANQKYEDELEEIRSNFVPNPPSTPSGGSEALSAAADPVSTAFADDSERTISVGRLNNPFTGFLAAVFLIGLVLLLVYYKKGRTQEDKK